MHDFNSRFDDAGLSIGLSFVKVYNLWHKKVKDALKQLGLTHPQFVVLSCLGYLSQTQREVKQVDIARQSDIDVMTVSTIIKSLVRKKLVRAQVSATDTRAKSIALTDSGAATVNRATPVVEQIDQDFFDILGPEQSRFHQGLQWLIAGNRPDKD